MSYKITYACLLEVLQYLYFRESKVGVIELLGCGLRGVEGGVQDNCGIGGTGMIVVMGGGEGGVNRSVELLEIGILAWLLSLYSTNPFIQVSRILSSKGHVYSSAGIYTSQ